MLSFDETTLRKAAAWQDFKEAQSLLNIGAVDEAERTPNGWKGSVRLGKRVYRASVDAKTPTWLDANCSCPANRREGTFCPHAIAIGLHLVSPPPATKKVPQPQPQKQTAPAPLQLPRLAWQIRFQGPWERAMEKGHAAIALSPSDHEPTPADDKLTAWLIDQKAHSKTTLQLALSPKTLPGFLHQIRNHPRISAGENPLSIDSGAQLHLADCTLKGEHIHLMPGTDRCFSVGDSFWKLKPGNLSRIGSGKIPPSILPYFTTLAEGKPCRLSVPAFLTHLDSLHSYLDFTGSEWFESLQFTPATPVITLRIDGGSSRLTAALQVSYTEENLPILDGQKVITRNPLAEVAALKTLAARTGSPGSTTIHEIRSAPDIQNFLTKSVKNLPSTWKIEFSPTAEKLSSSYVFISPEIKILTSDDDQMSFDLTFRSDSGAVIPTAEIRRLLRSGNPAGQQLKGKQIILSDDIESLIDPLFEDLDLKQENGHFSAKKASAAIIREIAHNLDRSTPKTVPDDNSQVIHIPEINAELRPYQAKGFSWLVNRLDKYEGALLADDMGLGKTLQTITCIEYFLRSYSQSGPVIIVVTTSLLGNWLAEFNRFAPERRVITLHGAHRDKLRADILPGDVILTTYGTLARDLAYHLKQEYSLAVIDEASLIRNPDTDHSKAVAKLNATRRLALTGTPVENSARDLWSIFRFIQPGWLGTRKDFQERYEIPLKSPDTSAQASTLLRLKTSPFVLRRTKLEVAPELPSKIIINEYCTLSKEQLATYRDLQKEGLRKIDEIRQSGQKAAARMATLTTLLRLRQTCCDLALFDSEKLKKLPVPRRSAKLERLLEICEQSISSGSKILVFSQFQKQLIEIESQLDSLGIASLRLDGQTRNRQVLVNEFQDPEGPPVFLISLKAGGYGLNLTAADIVVHFDPWWNPAAEAQATDRAHRIGQTKPVTVYRLLTRGTVEEKVVELQSTKQALADSLDENVTPTDAPAYTAADLERLLS
ncbi:SNF2-related protein [Luteolibacter algae]|uniref:SNF2-related protein n=1 Tax=Luteolibacter algae TaxID=454151 RepID=A0ABW5DA63_9BACT